MHSASALHRPHRRDSSKTPSVLTPQRKHHKLLKDGSGTEVWPDAVEQVFVNGLHEYWHSPWAASHTGRSRWRNQFLVDFLRGNGIYRTKKQVASHLQVLRNMWKGEPRFQLVAGSDDLNSMSPAPFDNGFTSSPASPSVKLEDSVSDMSLPPGTRTYSRVSALTPSSPDPEISDDLTSGSSSVGSPPHDFSAEYGFPSSPQSTAVSSVDSDSSPWLNSSVQLPSLYYHGFRAESTIPPPVSSTSTTPSGRQGTSSTARSPHLSPAQQQTLPSDQHHALQQAQLHQLPQQQQQHHRVLLSDGNPDTFHTSPLRNATYPYLADSPRPRTSDPLPAVSGTCIPQTTTSSAHDNSICNRITTFNLFAHCMTPLTIKLDGLLPASSSPMPSQKIPPAYLYMRLHIPSSDDMTSPSTLNGFTVNINLARLWSRSARCVTKEYHLDANDVSALAEAEPSKADSCGSVPTSLPSYGGSNARKIRKDLLTASVCIGEETGFLSVLEIERGAALAELPDSVLGRCRWVNQGVRIITQEIIIDEEVLLYLVYELDRKDSLPSVELLRWQRCPNSRRVPGFAPAFDQDANLAQGNASVSTATLNRDFFDLVRPWTYDDSETSWLISPLTSNTQQDETNLLYGF